MFTPSQTKNTGLYPLSPEFDSPAIILGDDTESENEQEVPSHLSPLATVLRRGTVFW